MASLSKRQSIFNMLNGKCFYCGCELDFDNFHLDHYRAKARGGKVTDNLVPSCPECNLCKSCLSIEEFREKLSNDILNTFQGKMIGKYYNVKPQAITFYFERVKSNGIV